MSFGITAATVAITIGATAITVGEIAIAATVIGASLSIAGAVTHNKTLTQIGMGFGIAGGVIGIATLLPSLTGTAAVGALSEIGSSAALSADVTAAGNISKGVTGAVELAPASTPAVAEGTGGAAVNAAKAPLAGVGEAPLTGSAAGPGTLDVPTGAPAVNAQNAAASTPKGILAQEAPGGTNVARGTTLSTPTSATPGQSFNFSTGAMTPVRPGVTAASLGDLAGPTADAPGWAAKFWAGLDPSAKGAIMLAGGQAVAGGVGGIFAGMSADKQLALQQLINQQNQNQRVLQNERATSNPGLIQFNHGPQPMAPMAPIAPTV